MTSTEPRPDVYYDPYDFEIDADPYPIWRRLREEAPLYYNERYDFYALSRFDDVDSAMPIAQEEVFGPVLTVLGYTDDADAVRLADDTPYGLSGSVWTADVDRGLDIARRVRSGTFGVNQPYSMDPAGPFGGVKASGLGREMGREGLDEYLEVKAISIAPTP